MEKFRFNFMTSVSSASFICCLLMLFGEVCYCIEIRRLSIPRWVENGTEEFVILDCEIVYNENDMRLVLKWFFNGESKPVYQWIPELNRRYKSDEWTNRLDMNFSVNTVDAYSKFRALRILRPTTEMSGLYTCHVASLAGQDWREQNMIVYVPAKEFELSYTELNDSLVNVTCDARGLFPSPVLTLYLGSSLSDQFEPVTDVNTFITQTHSGVYDVSLYRIFNVSDLTNNCSLTVFECSIELPDTNYAKTKRIAYYPDPEESLTSTSQQNLSSLHLLIGIIASTYFFKWSVQSSITTSVLNIRTCSNDL